MSLVILAIARVPGEAVFDNISLVRIGAGFVNNRQENKTWCEQYGLLATEMVCLTCNHRCGGQTLDGAADAVT